MTHVGTGAPDVGLEGSARAQSQAAGACVGRGGDAPAVEWVMTMSRSRTGADGGASPGGGRGGGAAALHWGGRLATGATARCGWRAAQRRAGALSRGGGGLGARNAIARAPRLLRDSSSAAPASASVQRRACGRGSAVRRRRSANFGARGMIHVRYDCVERRDGGRQPRRRPCRREGVATAAGRACHNHGLGRAGTAVHTAGKSPSPCSKPLAVESVPPGASGSGGAGASSVLWP